jgi:uncharacterized protein
MKNKLLTLIFLVFFLSVPLFAGDHIVDNAGLLNKAEIAELEKLAEAIASNYKFDLVIVTEKDIGSVLPMAYADNYFDNNGYGIGENRDGCIFLQVTGSRDYWFSTSGRGIKILNTSALYKLESDVVSHLSNNYPIGAYRAFIDTWEKFLVLDAQGRSYNFFYQYNMILIIIVWVISLLTGLIIILSWKKQMNTALAKEQADNFIVPGSLVFTQQTDRFLYSTVTKTAKPKPSSTTSSSIGTHISSSGRSHGGGGGKY